MLQQRHAVPWGAGPIAAAGGELGGRWRCVYTSPSLSDTPHPPTTAYPAGKWRTFVVDVVHWDVCSYWAVCSCSERLLARSLTCGRAGHRVYDAREAAQALRVCQRRLACALTHKCTVHILCLYGDTVHVLLVAMYTHTPACEIRHI